MWPGNYQESKRLHRRRNLGANHLRGKAQGIGRSLRLSLARVNGTDVTFGHASFGDMVASSELGLGLTTTYGQRPALGGVANSACP